MPEARLEHVGYVVASIAEAAGRYARYLQLEWDGAIVHDPLQNVRVSFLAAPVPGAPRIELVEPVDETSPVTAFLARGGGIHHVCYEVDSLDAELERCRAAGAALVKPPLPAVAFGGRRICWTANRDRLLVEWLERAPSPS
jgi:methylmalonyl-CoA/ethylmalonyl-CoA epimerase